jgi:hypothetical protein
MLTGLELVDRERPIVLEILFVIQVMRRPSKIMIPAMVDDEKKGAQDASRPSVVDDSCIACVVVHVCR